jgi:glycosyltransferase involved in cell wall biosynthesis
VVFDMHESTARQIKHKQYLSPVARNVMSFIYRCTEGLFIHGQAIVLANEACVPLYKRKTYLARNYPELNPELMQRAAGMKSEAQKPLLVYAGGIAEVRGALLYVDLVGKLVERGHDVEAVIAGPCLDEFDRRLHERIRHLNLEDRVSVPGELPYAEAMELVARSTIGLCLLMPVPNYVTCLATKIIEYMMTGTPVLASDFEVWRPYVEGERTGRVADPLKLDQVVSVCEQMLADPDELRRMGERGMVAVREKYNWESEFREILRCYDDLLGEDA